MLSPDQLPDRPGSLPNGDFHSPAGADPGRRNNPGSDVGCAAFNYIRYGLDYQNIVLPAAQQNGFDPLFMYSVIRQESLFEGFVQSTAGARG